MLGILRIPGFLCATLFRHSENETVLQNLDFQHYGELVIDYRVLIICIPFFSLSLILTLKRFQSLPRGWKDGGQLHKLGLWWRINEVICF